MQAGIQFRIVAGVLASRLKASYGLFLKISAGILIGISDFSSLHTYLSISLISDSESILRDCDMELNVGVHWHNVTARCDSCVP